MSPERETSDLPAAIEEQACEILLGPPDLVDSRFAALCAANEPQRSALLRLRADYQRAAHMLHASGDESPSALPPTIGPHRIVRQLGEGAFGVVFLAEQQEPIRREVALKLLHTATTSRTTMARFHLERETLARMNHPAIARIFDAGVDHVGRPYFVMEYVPGEPLHRFVATRAADLRARLDLFLAACEGVNHAHQRGVIHRDLKPQNVLVADVDGRWLPKVIDFGLAKVVAQDVDVVKTAVGAVLGTPAYMSPEQLRGDGQDVDVRTDVYALGVILYELLTSTRPVEPGSQRGRGLQEVQRLLLETEVPLASLRAAQSGMAHARALRGDLDWILRKAMARNQNERYSSVAEFAADLRRFLAHEPVLAGPPSAGYLVRKFVRRHRTAVVAAAIVFVALLAGFLVSTSLYREAHASDLLAREHLADFWRLADVLTLDELVAEEKRLWPSQPGKLTQHEQWLARAQALVTARALHADTVEVLRRRVEAQPADVSAGERDSARFLLRSLQKHLAALDSFAGPGGLLRDVERRTSFARTVVAHSIDEQRAAWDRAIEVIADSPRYDGIVMRRVPGLVPLGPDPVSGLEEFAHLQSGRVPERGPDGRLHIDDDTAIVLVLVPGGSVLLGNQNTDPKAPHFDPHRQSIEMDVTTLTGAPFLIGKYELTQGQVKQLGVAVQAFARAGQTTLGDVRITPRHPEEQVLAPAVLEWLPRFELRLPTHVEWEVAARAGSGSIWSTGDDIASLQGRANVADASFGVAGLVERRFDASLHDGFLHHAPVGNFPPNAFGLHDMIGNVAEVTVAARADGGSMFLARGGSFMLPPLECRLGSVRQQAPNQTTPEIGVRVARSVASD